MSHQSLCFRNRGTRCCTTCGKQLMKRSRPSVRWCQGICFCLCCVKEKSAAFSELLKFTVACAPNFSSRTEKNVPKCICGRFELDRQNFTSHKAASDKNNSREIAVLLPCVFQQFFPENCIDLRDRNASDQC